MNAYSRCLIAGLIAGFAGSGALRANEAPATTLLVIEKTSIGGDLSYEHVSAEAMKTAQSELRLKATSFSKALSAAEKQWKEDKALSKHPFPRAELTAPKIRQVAAFKDEEAAQKRVKEMQEKHDLELKKQEDYEKKKADRQAEKDKKDKKDKKPAKKSTEMTREEIVAKAESFVEAKLAELLAPKAPAE